MAYRRLNPLVPNWMRLKWFKTYAWRWFSVEQLISYRLILYSRNRNVLGKISENPIVSRKNWISSIFFSRILNLRFPFVGWNKSLTDTKASVLKSLGTMIHGQSNIRLILFLSPKKKDFERSKMLLECCGSMVIHCHHFHSVCTFHIY